MKLDEKIKKLDLHYCKIRKSFDGKLKNIQFCYAKNFAERAFHDRQLCEYISQLIAAKADQTPSSWSEEFRHWSKKPLYGKIKRCNHWPKWIQQALIERENYECPMCGTDFNKLTRNFVIDHIVPLAKMGTNDICNLQLLCSQCNRKKSSNNIDVISSIPSYLQSAF